MDFYNSLLEHIRVFNWHSPSWDLFIVLGWLIAGVMYAFAAGKGRIMNILVSVFMAKLLVIEAPFIGDEINRRFNLADPSWQQLIAFVALFALIFMFMSRYAFRTSGDSRHMAAFPFTVVFAIAQVGLLINIIVGFLPTAATENFSQLVRFLFIDYPADFVWLILPLILLVAFGKMISDRSELK